MSRVPRLLLAITLLLPGAVLAADAPDVPLVIEHNTFKPAEIRVKAGTAFTLAVTNKDASAEELESKALKIEKIVPPGKTVRVRVPALRAGSYDFVGEYHEKTARGRIVAE